jgi:Type II secretion system protein C
MSADYAGQWRMRSAAWLRIATVLLAIILVASVTKWALTFSARRTPAEPLRTLPAGQVEAKAPSVDSAAISRLFGASGPAGNISALGVMAEGSSGRGIALIRVDGEPPRVVHAGQPIAPGVILAEVQRNSVVVERAGAMQEIRIVHKPAPPDAIVPEQSFRRPPKRRE